uniref:NACHT domain-containing protein n=1 Tax=Cyprinus carpio TaxID=7962 RepID=A0A8C1Y275_CYPCA
MTTFCSKAVFLSVLCVISVRSGSHVSSSVSVKSDCSKGVPPNFSEKTSPTKSIRSGSHVSSSVSVKSDKSKGEGPYFSEKKTSPNKRVQHEKSGTKVQKCHFHKKFRENLHSIFQDLEDKIITFLKYELEKFKKILKKENTQYFVRDKDDMCSIKEAALDLTLYFLRDMKQDEAADTLEDKLVFMHLKSNLKKKYQRVFEGIAKQGDATLLNNIYTDLYITQGGSEQVNTEHEVRQIEVTSRRHESQEIQVECTHLFKPRKEKKIKTVLTKGVAGIGKSVSVQKFVLDWAEGKENQDISFIFPLPFREMNLQDKEKQSLMDLITQFFPETKGLNLAKRNMYKVLFILDGLDEFRLPLNFKDNETLCDALSPASLDVLLTNLIKGNLLPSALIWITTRPAAASKIPPDCIDQVTEIRGFNDAQKEEDFRKRFENENQAKEIIDHVKKSKSLFIMCHIPVFCWISATVLQNILEMKTNNDLKNNQSNDASKTLQESNTEDTPKTLTQMYTHFLRFQIQQSRRKYDGEYTPDVSWDKDAILSLGKLAFHQLERNNVIFYESDLEACGIDVYKASVYSGMCTQIFKEETGIILGTMYCFVHLSIQEFIAALYAHLFLDINKKSVFVHESTEQDSKKETLTDLLKTVVDKALESDNGHLDLFLRFLLGLSIQSNRLLLQGLLTQQDENDQSKKEIVQYIKQKFEANLSPERSINLFYCLNELNDQTLVKEIQTHLSKGSLSSVELSPAQWSAVAFVLLTSKEELEEFELQKFKKSDECLIRLSAVIKNSKIALLNDCDLTDRSCSALATVLGSDTNLKELNMNNNNLQDPGVKLLCTGLEDLKCELEILRLSDCGITEEGYKALASALRSNPSHLIELDLTGNDPGQLGVKELNDLLQDPNCRLKTLRFLSPDAEEACQYVTGVVGKNPLLLRELNLSENELGDTRVNQITALLQDKHCKLNTLQLSNCSITEEGYKALASALRSNPSHLIELDLTGNDPGQSGVKELNDLLQDPNCQLKTLRFLGTAADKACQDVNRVLGENLLLLRELNLSELGLSGLNKLAAVLQDKHCKLNKLILNNSDITEEDCCILTEALNSNPSNLTELNLSGTKLRNSGMKIFSTLFKNEKCSLQKLMFNCISITEEGCAALASAFNSNPSNLIELDLSENKLGNYGVTEISTLLANSQCTLQILRLSDCSITEEGYKALSSALKLNPSHLIELDLTGNDPGQSGVKQLTDLLQDPNCKLKTLRFLGPAADEARQYVIKVQGENPLLLKELNLSLHELGDTRVNQIAALLQDKHCKLNTLILCGCCITEKQCFILTSTLKSNPSHLRELDLSGNKIENKGVKHLCNLLIGFHCKMERLRLRGCDMTDEGCSALTSALKSNPSHLRELDLSENKLGDSGFENISNLLMNPECKLEILSLCKCSIKEKQCVFLTSALKSNPSHLRELDLSGNVLKHTRVNKFYDILKESRFKLERLRLRYCAVKAEDCSALTSALKSKSSHLRELALSGNELGQLGATNLCDILMNPQCKLEKLDLCRCSITEKQCLILTSALKSNPSHLRELNLSVNQLGDSGVENLGVLLGSSECKLEKIHLCGCRITEKHCLILTSELCSNLSHLRELDLSGNKIENKGVQILCDILNNSHCKLERLSLNDCGITDVACLAQTLAETKVLLFLKELDLSNNKIGGSKQQLIDVLQDSNCELNLEKEHLLSWIAGVNYIGSFGGWLTSWSKAQEDPVESTEQEKVLVR